MCPDRDYRGVSYTIGNVTIPHNVCFGVELHVHLDGAIRHETILDLAKKKGLSFAKDLTSAAEVRSKLVHASPCKDLGDFLAPFALYYNLLVGDLDAIERIAYEFCQTQSENNVAYFEVRYCPHLLATTSTDTDVKFGKDHVKHEGEVTAEEVLCAVNKGLKRGSTEFNVQYSSILIGFSGKIDMIEDLLQLCIKYKNDRVFGMDMATLPRKEPVDEVPKESEEAKIFQRAKQLGIHITLHAGECGGAESVKLAIEDFGAERIGHGYRVVEDENVYALAKEKGVHFEACPWSSYLTNAVSGDWKDHPIQRFMADGVSFGLSTDDPTMTGNYMAAEVALVQRSMGWTDEQIKQLQVNAANASFLGADEKTQLLKLISS